MKNKNLLIISLVILPLALAACTTKTTVPATNSVPAVSQGTNQPVNSTQNTATLANTAVTLTEVAKHSTATDCWMIIDGQAYDFTPYIQSGMHPGGQKIVNGCGQDASAMFASIQKHSGRARQDMAQYLIVR